MLIPVVSAKRYGLWSTRDHIARMGRDRRRDERLSRRNPVGSPEKCRSDGLSAAGGSSVSCRGLRRLRGIFPSDASVGLLPGFRHARPSSPGRASGDVAKQSLCRLLKHPIKQVGANNQ
jgi:hypothetical protein